MRQDPVALRRAVTAIAAQQAGYFTAAQALAVGYSYQTQRYHAGRGDWQRVDRGIYRLPEWPASRHEDLARWTLWSRDRAVVSHQTALDVHELGDVMPARVDLTVPPGFRSRSPAVLLHVSVVDPTDVERHEGFAVTTPVRSIVDAADTGIEVDQLEQAIRDALDRGLVTVESLRARADAHGARSALAVERALGRMGR
jgi:predicted transcriptional regulator of viral defense system